jgi:uncharacterized protein (TIGR03437 family)
VIFIAFDREEQGLIGSTAWVRDHPGYRIHSMISLDMIGFNPPGAGQNVIALCTATNAPNPAVPALASAVSTYSGGIVPSAGCVSRGSDHVPFSNITSSVLMIESAFSRNVNYHKATDSVDTPDYIDTWFAAGITRSTVGYLAMQAGLLPPTEGAARLTAAGIANAASWVVGPAASGQLLSLIGAGLSLEGAPASTVVVTDAAGVERPASLTYASARQINLVLPERLAEGEATVTVARGDGVRVSAAVPVEATAPGFFTADSSGAGAAAAQAVLVSADGTQTIQNLYACAEVCASVPVDFGGDNQRVVLVFYGTGLRGGSAAVTASAAGRALGVEYAGPQPSIPGLDQVNVALPRDLLGAGEVQVTFEVDGKRSNPILINLGSTI